MRLKLKNVHLVNFRKHADYMFTPAVDGITAILGENGHGKSSIIDGIAWCLYGVKPSKSLKNIELKRNTAAVSDPCFVEVMLAIDDNNVIKVRRTLKGKNATVQCECYLNDKLEAGPSVANADKWIPKTLGLDSEGFLSAVLVQQKQVDDIISQTAAVRQSNIEKLTGITAATNALKTARDEANSLKKAIELIAPDVNEKDKYVDIIDKTKTDIQKIQSKRDDLKQELTDRMSTYVNMKNKLDEAKNNNSAAEKLNYELSSLKSNLEIMSKQRDDYLEQVVTLKENLPDSTDASSIRKELNSIESKLQDLQATYAKNQAIYDSSPSNADLKALRDELSELEESKPSFHDDINAITEQLSSLESEISKNNAIISQSEASLHDINEYIHASNDDGNAGSIKCPTCLQEISEPSHVIDEFNDIISKAKEAIKQLTDERNGLNEQIKAINDYEKHHDDITVNIDNMKTLIAKAHDARKVMDSIKPELEATRKQANVFRNRLAEMRNDEMRIRQYKQVARAFEEATDNVNKTDSRILEVKKELSEIKTTPDRSINALENKVNALNDSIMSMKEKAVELKGESALLNERLANAQNALERAERDEEKRRKALHKHEIAQASVKVLSGFREHLAKESVPSITDYASDLVNEITNGMFTSVNMDEKYNITVTDDKGKIMDVHALSGGEQSVVAISLRLAISEMLSGGEPSMLILDEVLTAMDDNRSQAILNAIQEAGHGQVIIIAHNEIIRSIADTVIML